MTEAGLPDPLFFGSRVADSRPAWVHDQINDSSWTSHATHVIVIHLWLHISHQTHGMKIATKTNQLTYFHSCGNAPLSCRTQSAGHASRAYCIVKIILNMDGLEITSYRLRKNTPNQESRRISAVDLSALCLEQDCIDTKAMPYKTWHGQIKGD